MIAANKLFKLLFIVLITAPLFISAQLKLPYFFSDNMVLQQQTDAAIWGWAKAGSNISVTTSWNKKKYSTTTTADGKWKLKVATPTAGGPYDITISDGKPVVIKNILIGEVWLCSGQSNMEIAMKGFKDQPILGSNDAVFNSTNPNIRLYTVPRSVQRMPQDTSKNSLWRLTEPEAVSNFSATAYFFGKILGYYSIYKVLITLKNSTIKQL